MAAFPGVERFVLLLERGAQPLELRCLFGQRLFEFRDALFGRHTREWSSGHRSEQVPSCISLNSHGPRMSGRPVRAPPLQATGRASPRTSGGKDILRRFSARRCPTPIAHRLGVPSPPLSRRAKRIGLRLHRMARAEPSRNTSNFGFRFISQIAIATKSKAHSQAPMRALILRRQNAKNHHPTVATPIVRASYRQGASKKAMTSIESDASNMTPSNVFDFCDPADFQEWVAQTIVAYARARRNPVHEAGKLSHVRIGEAGERFTEARLSRRGFVTARSPGSRSPGDVWGVRETKDLVHLALIQVKTTLERQQPEELGASDVAELEKFASFCWDEFFEVAKEHIGVRPLLVSCGYVGVRLTDWLPARIVSCDSYSGWVTRGHVHRTLLFDRAIGLAHDLDVVQRETASNSAFREFVRHALRTHR